MPDRVLRDHTEEAALEAIGWFFDGPYMDHPEAIDDLAAIIALWKADRKPRVVSDG